MARLLITLFIVILIATGVVWEQIFFNQTFNELNAKLDAITLSVQNCPEDAIDTEDNKAMIAELYNLWVGKERILSYLVKHTETFQISDSLLYAKNFIGFNNKEEAMFALTKLQYLFSIRNYSFGTSFQNII